MPAWICAVTIDDALRRMRTRRFLPGLLQGVTRTAVHVGAFLPLVWLVHALYRAALGGDPVQALIHFLGMGALRLLLLSLMISPLVKILHFPLLMQLRRPLGLWCFVWASLHIAAWATLDLGMDWHLVGAELVERTYILLGLAAWLVLALLAITSLPVLVRRLGRRWKSLHRLSYAGLLLVCVHFWWSAKSGWIEPAIYFVMALMLLLPRGKALFNGTRRRISGS